MVLDKIKKTFIKGNANPIPKFSVKIVKQHSETKFQIADNTGDCELVLENPKALHSLLIIENNHIKILKN